MIRSNKTSKTIMTDIQVGVDSGLNMWYNGTMVLNSNKTLTSTKGVNFQVKHHGNLTPKLPGAW